MEAVTHAQRGRVAWQPQPRREAWLLVGLLAIVAYDLIASSWARAILYDGLALGAAAAMTWRALSAPPGARAPAAFAAAALALWAAGGLVSGSVLDNGWMLAYVLFGAAALTRERMIVLTPEFDDVGIGRRRVLLVASAGLVSPFALVVGSLTGGTERDLVSLGAVATALAVLTIVRLEQMFRRIGDLHAKAEQARLRAEATEQALALKHERLLESEERWRTLVESLEERRLTQRLEAVGQLAAGIAHEINTPMQYVENSVSFVRAAVDDAWALIDRYRELLRADRALAWDERRELMGEAEDDADLEYMRRRLPEAFDRVVEGVERVTTIVRAMRSFAHPPTTELAPASLNEAIAATLAVCRNEYKYVADIELDLGDLPPVLCNAGDLNQVFLNLVVNAAHAIQDVVGRSGERGTITIRTRAGGGQVSVEVTDTGNGIPEDVRERIFEPFFTTKEVGRGTGQGLAIAQAIVARHEGRIEVADAPAARGTTVRVQLPQREPAQLAA